jgi:hypothetical protein
MVDQALLILSEADTFAAIEYLNQQPDALQVGTVYSELVKHLHWQERDLPLVVAMSRAGIQYCLDQGELAAGTDMAQALRLRSLAKQLAYNLASFTWPGWDEPGVTPQPEESALGLDAARLNVRLALELDKGDLALSRAYWMLAAHLLTAKAVSGAESNFRRAAMYAQRAGSAADALLAEGFAHLANLVLSPSSATWRQALVENKRRLAELEHGPAFVLQLDTAQRLFLPD